MKTSIWMAVLMLLAAGPSQAQSVDSLVLQGRALLAKRDLTNANVRFRLAVAVSPNHQTANFLYAATRVLTLPYTQPADEMLDRLGFSLTNRNVYRWRSEPVADTNGIPVPPNDFASTELVHFLRTNALVQVSGAQSNLARIHDPNFILSLTSNETSTTAVTVDYGDVQMLRALLAAAEFTVLQISSLDLDAQLNALYAIHAREEFDIEHLLLRYPMALGYAHTNDLAAARTAFQRSAEAYFSASAIIRSRPTNIVRLFTYDPELASEEERLRKTLAELVASLNKVVVLSTTTNRTQSLAVNLGPVFSGKVPLRPLLPELQQGGVLLGSLPDPTFGGVLFGMSENDVYEAISGGLKGPALPSFVTAGPGQLKFHALNDRNYSIQQSIDLRTWHEVGTIRGARGFAVVDVPPRDPQGADFFRVEDLSTYPSFSGVVLDGSSLGPIQGAIIGSSVDGTTVVTDASGRFSLQTRPLGKPPGWAAVTAFASGYAVGTAWVGTQDGNEVKDLVFRLVRGDVITEQPKDATVAEGAPVVLRVVTSGVPNPAYRWRKDGAFIGLAKNQEYRISAANLTDAGEYSVVVSGNGWSVTSRVAKVTVTRRLGPPVITTQPVSLSVPSGGSATFSVTASGGGVLRYQWYRNDVALATGVQSTYRIAAVKSSDAGSYKVVVSNGDGSVTSRSVTLTVR